MTDCEPSTPRAKGRPSLQEASGIDDAIRQAAVTVLLEQGAAATLNAVAHAAGLSRKSVYARFPNKQALFLHVIRDMLGSAQGVQYERSGSAEQRLRAFILAGLDLMASPKSSSIQRLLTLNPAYIEELKAEMLAATIRHFFVPLQELLREAVAAGAFVVHDIDVTTRLIIRLMFAESVGTDGQLNVSAQLADREYLANNICDLITRGLLPR